MLNSRRKAAIHNLKKNQKNKSNTIRSPKQEHGNSSGYRYEFGGPIGVFFTITLLPCIIYGLHSTCTTERCLTLSEVFSWDAFKATFPGPHWKELCSINDFVLVVLWILFQILLERILPGESVQGEKLPHGERLTYRLNGHLAFWVTALICAFGYPVYGPDGSFLRLTHLPLSYLYDHYLQLATSAMIISFVLSIYLYITSFFPGRLLAPHGTSPSWIYNFFMGRELNPRIGATFDLKYFCELRPGLIGWIVLNVGMLAKQYEVLEGRITVPMLMVNGFQFLYVWDALYHERSILTTMDITTDGFGFMLAFGDLSWVPFIYSFQCRYLVNHSPELSTSTLSLLLLGNLAGYVVFRSANGEKDAFRRDPNSDKVAHLKYIQTKRGTKLLISGWWGLARKINYTGDWLMSFCWCALCGTLHVWPYFYCIYFAILLIHRAIRDHQTCQAKYGEDWMRYKSHVPYAFIPKII